MLNPASFIRYIGGALWFALCVVVLSATAWAGQQPFEAVFIDPRVSDYEELLGGIDHRTSDVVIVDTTRSGIAQIAEALSIRPTIQAIHVISHGESGQVEIGEGAFSLTDIPRYAGELRSIGNSLGSSGEILFYGCDIGKGERGSAFIHQVAELSGVRVTASTNPTGASSRGGDWVLEHATGSIQTGIVVGSETIRSYAGILISGTVSNGARGGLTLIPASSVMQGGGFEPDSNYYIGGTPTGGRMEMLSGTIVNPGPENSFSGSEIEDEHLYFRNTDECVTSGYFELYRSDGLRWEITINFSSQPASVSVTTSPSNQTVCSGSSASFSVAASAPTTPTVQWQLSTNSGANWSNIDGATSTTYSFTAAASQSGNLYRAVFTGTCSTATTQAASLTVNTAPGITTNPSNQTVCAGGTATFSAAASGSPTPTVQWQVSTDGGTNWGNIDGATSTTLSFTAAASQNGNKYRAVFTNICSTATTSPATLTVNTAPSVTTNPSNQTVCAGSTATFSAAASGSPTPTVQWQVSTDGGTNWGDIDGATSTTLSFTAAASQNGNKYRAVFTNTCGEATTTGATLTVNTAPSVTTNPSNQTVCAGNTATFSAAASGSPTPTVQWQVSTDGGSNWGNIDGATSTSLSFTSSASQTGNQYRAVFTNTCSTATTSPATLTVNTAPSVTTNPSNQTVCAGNTATFSAAASGSPTPTVQWQLSTDGGTNWGNIDGATSTSLSFSASVSQSGNQYRAVFTNTCSTATTSPATLTVNTAPGITASPSNQTVCAGATATFSAAASGSPTPTVQWQVSTDGGSNWGNIDGATSTSMNFAASASQSGNRYRAVFTNTCGDEATTAASLTVNTSPGIIASPSNQTVCSGGTATFTASASGSPTPTVQWQLSTDGGSNWGNIDGATSTSMNFAASASQSGNQYRAVFTNICSTATTSPASLTVNTAPGITASPSNQTVCSGGTATFTASASGSPTPTVQWQLSTDGGSNWGNIDGAASTTLSFSAAASQSGNLYRAVFTNTCSTATTSPSVLTVNVAPSIGTDPSNQVVCAGGSVTFVAAASGSPTPGVQWQVSTNGGADWNNISGATSTSLTFTAMIGLNGNQYRAIFANLCGDATTTAAALTVNGTSSITSNPSNQSACAGESVSFSAAATGSPAVQWQLSTDGGSNWGNIDGATSTTLSFTASASQSGNQYRAMFTTDCGSEPTSGATLTVNTAPGITTSPTDETVCGGGTATFTAAASGSPTPTVQWQVSTDGGSNWGNIDGATSTTLSFTASVSQNGNEYRAVFTNSCSTATTGAATLTVNGTSSITTSPSNQSACAGENVSFSAAASGSPAVQWQVSTDGGSNWGNIDGATSTTLSFAAAASQSGSRYRAVFTTDCGSESTSAATLTVNTAPGVTASPSDETVCGGGTATFTAAASGSPTPTVQWQVSTDGGTNWGNIDGATSTSLSFTAGASQDGNEYRAVFSNTCSTATTGAATLTVNGSSSITGNPSNQSACVGGSVNFSAAASGSPAVQWQVSTDGGTNWGNIDGATSTTLSFDAVASQSGNRYRAVFTTDCGSEPTTGATLTVNTSPSVTASPSDETTCGGSTVTFTAAASGSPTPGVQWQVSTNGGSDWNDIGGATSTTLNFTASASQNGNEYRAVFTNTCSTATTGTATLTINGSASITTNPSNQSRCPGESVTFTAGADGTQSVQWQVSTNSGGDWNNVPNATSTSLTFTVAASQNGNQYRALFTGDCGSIPTSAATLSITTGLTISTNPSSQSACSGATVTFNAASSTSPTPSVRWQVSTNSGGSWNDISGASSTSLSFTASAAQNGNQYRAVFTNSCGSEPTSAATLTINSAPGITTNPSSQTKCSGASVTFLSGASGSPTPTVRWQLSTNSGGSWNDISGASSTSLTFTTAASQNGYQYRAVYTNTCTTATTTAATLSIGSGLSITTNATSQTVCAGANATFTAAASGSPTPSVQWQMSTNSGGTWGDISGATSTTLTFAAPYSINGRQYRAVFTSSCGSVTTSAATLTVYAPPTISVSVSPTSLWPPNNSMRTINASITTTGNCTPLAVTLVSISSDEGDESNDVSGATYNSDDRSFSLRAQRNGNGNGRVYTITYRVTDNGGNTATATATVQVPHNSSKLVVTPGESAPELVTLEQNIPNPFTQETEIGFILGMETEVTLKIFDEHGREVATLVHDQRAAGRYTVRWNGRDDNGHLVANGIYLCQIQAAETTVTSRIVLLR